MAIMVQGSERITDEALPLAALAAQMRLPDGYDSVPGQLDRMRARLRAAIASVEARCSKILIARNAIVTGEVPGGTRVTLPVAPVAQVVSASGGPVGRIVSLSGLSIEDHPHLPVALLDRSLAKGTFLTMTLRAGYGDWADVPGGLQQAVLLMAEMFESGAGEPEAQIKALIAPYLVRRVGGRV